MSVTRFIYRKSLLEQLQAVGEVAPVSFGFADDHGPNLRRIADQQRMALTLDQRMKPQRVAGALDTDRDGAWQGRIELVDGVAVVNEAKFLRLPRFGIEDSHLLIPTVQVTAHECYGTASFSSRPCDVPLGRVCYQGREGRSHDINVIRPKS